MMQLLFYMNGMGSLFVVIHTLLLPLERIYIPPKYRVGIYRINLMLFIIPFPVCLFFIRRYFENIISIIPVVPFVYSGSHMIVHLKQNISFALPRLNYFQIVLLSTWIIVTISKYLIFVKKNHRYHKFTSFLDMFQKEELAKCSFDVTELANRAMKEMNLKKKPRILLQDGKITPHVSGIFRQTLCLPSQWDVPEQVYYMAIKHELAHIKNKDLLFQRLSLIARIISWFNPFLYLLCLQMEDCEEFAADACACESSSAYDCNAYQTAILNATCLLSSVPDMPVRGLRFKRTRKKYTKERILTMKNKNLYKHKTIKLAATALMSAVIFTLSAVPALAYNLPSELEIADSTVKPMSAFDLNLLPSESESALSPVSIEPVKDEVNSLFKNIDYSDSDLICIDENGVVSNGIIDPQIIECNHNYLAAQVSTHDKNSDGSCTITYYKAKKCAKCGRIVIQERIATTTYDKCPH